MTQVAPAVIYSQALALLRTPQVEQGYAMLKDIADQGFEPAQLRLGEMFTRGQFVPLRSDLAEGYLQPLVIKGNQDAIKLFSLLKYEENQVESAGQILNQSKDSAQGDLLHSIGLLLISRNKLAALNYFAKATASSHLGACFAYLACGQEFQLTLNRVLAEKAQSRISNADYPLKSELGDSFNLSEEEHSDELESINLSEKSQVGECQQLNDSPKVMITHGCVSLAERAHLISLAMPHMNRAEVIRTVGHNQGQESNMRTNSSMFLSIKEKDIVAADVERRVAQVCEQDHRCGEPFNFLNYKIGQEYQYHFDFFSKELASSNSYLKFGGQRVVTGILFLNHVDAGGETELPKIDVKQSPVPGSVLTFHNVDESGQPDKRSLHAGLPVIAGEKWVATRWFRANPRDNG